MSTNLSKAGRPASLSVRQAAWVLGVPTSTVHRAIRVGTLRATRRRSRLVVHPADLARLLGGAR
ncbi:helix-turn-helix domain-containing protein [Actinokineospora soli]|uniref:Helix-turn-helix domain-containing protein n=1 Tax=Actinokineospora soli TaxID=1048753 RepID=A0ABW2TPB4_9PSEU